MISRKRSYRGLLEGRKTKEQMEKTSAQRHAPLIQEDAEEEEKL